MNLKIKIHKNTYSARLVEGVPFNDEFNENLDSVSVVISKVKKMTLSPYDDAILYDTESNFKKHFLIANYNAQMINLTSGLFKYTIDLMSETKGLEKIVLPNINFKQPLLLSSKKSLYEIIDLYLQTYTPIRKYNIGNHKWAYGDKYTLTNDATFLQKTQNIVCPEFAFNSPTLRELMNFLFNVVDLLPVVRNNVVEYIDLSKPTGEYSFSSEENYITYTQSAENYSLNLVKDYQQGIGDSSHSNVVEFIGFRNIEEASLKLDNLRLETRFPIYSINKVYMYLWKKVEAYKPGVSAEYRQFPLLVQFDITDFIVSSEYRYLLNPTYVTSSLPTPDKTNETTKQQSIKDVTQYQIMTLAFNRGQQNIDGWGYKWSFYDPENNLGNLGWLQTSLSYLENLINYLGYLYPYGQGRTGNSVQNLLPTDWLLNEDENNNTQFTISNYVSDHMINPTNQKGTDTTGIKLIKKLKSVIFKVDYQPLSAARVNVHKRNVLNEEFSATDNQNTSMVVLETDGDNELYKAARLANELLQINGRYKDISHLLPLGAENEDGYIIFKRTYSIYNNEIKASYSATKNYILKNYFTSVFSKKRNKTFMGINESITRNENRTLNVLLSKTECYYDELNIYFSDYIPILSCFSSPNVEWYINGGLIYNNDKTYIQEINSFIVGNYIMCFDAEMQGNISVGNYINEFFPVDTLISNNKIEAVGSLQSSYVIGDSETGFTDYMNCSIVHLLEKNSFLQYNSKLSDTYTYSEQLASLRYLFSDYIFKKPELNTNNQEITFQISSDSMWKNNGEIINFNYQIDYSNLGKGLYIGKNFMLLNEMMRTKEKIFETYYDVLGAMKIDILYSTIDITSANEYNQTSRPILIINLPNESIDMLLNWNLTNSPIEINKTFIFSGTNSNKANPKLVDNFSIQINLIKITAITRTYVSVSFNATRTNKDGTVLTDAGTYIFKRFRTGNSTDNFVFREINDFSGYCSFGWGAFYEPNLGSFYSVDMQHGDPKFLYYGQQKCFEYDDGQVINNDAYFTMSILTPNIVDYTKPHYQNCFVFYNDESIDFEIDKKTSKSFTYSELVDDLGFYPSDLSIDKLFTLLTDEYGRKKIKIYSEYPNAKMICYFYHNSDDTYSLVFGCEFDNGLQNRTESVAFDTTVTRMFYGNKDGLYYVPADDGLVQSYSAVGQSTLNSQVNVPNGQYLMKQGSTYKFRFAADVALFQNTTDKRIHLESVSQDWQGSPLTIDELYLDNYSPITEVRHTPSKNWDTVWQDSDSQIWYGMADVYIVGRTISQLSSYSVSIIYKDAHDEDREVQNPTINVSDTSSGIRFNILATLNDYPYDSNVSIVISYELGGAVVEVSWTCPKTDYYYVNVFVTPENISSRVDINFMYLLFFDNTYNLTSVQEETLMLDGEITISSEPVIMYYQNIFISLLTNLNIRVYDSDNLLIGTAKNWYNVGEGVVVDNSFEDLVDNNDSED